MQRRKTLINGVTNSKFMSKEEIKSILSKLQIAENIRGENLRLEDYAKISNEYTKNIEKRDRSML